MSYSGSENTRGAWRNDGGVPPHAFDPYLQPELFRGVLTRRVFAFLIDLVVLSIPVILGYLFIAVFGLITLGLGWALFWLAWPATIVWAIVYYGSSIGGTALGHAGHARDGFGAVHLVRRAGLFRARRHARGAVLGFDLVPDTPGASGRAVQRPPAALARPRAGNRDHQQLGSHPGSTIIAKQLLSDQQID